MPWALILELVMLVLKLIFGLPMAEHAGWLSKLRAAKEKARHTGDTSDLQTLFSELAARHK